MTHPSAQALGILLAALLLATPAWADGGGLGGEKFNFELQYDSNADESDDSVEDDTIRGGTFGSFGLTPLGFGELRNPSGSTSVEEEEFSTTTKLRGQVTFGFGSSTFGATDRDLTNDSSITSRVRLNLDTSFTGRDVLRVRLNARDANGFAKQGKAPTVTPVNPVTFGHTEDGYAFDLKTRYSFGVGATWELRADYDTDNYSDGYITGRTVPEDEFEFNLSPDALFGSREQVRYISPTFAGFSLSTAWDERSGREVPTTPAQEDGGQNGVPDQPAFGFEIPGAYGLLMFHPQGREILDNVELIPSQFLLPTYRDYKLKNIVETSLQGFFGPGLRGGQGEEKQVEPPEDPTSFQLGHRITF